MFDQGYNREKLARVIGPEQADALIADLGNEAGFARTRDVVTGNSETAARAAAMGEIQGGGGDAGKVGIIKNLLDLNFGSAAADVGKTVFRGFGDSLRERRNADLARILIETGPDREGARRAFAALGRSVRAKDISSDTARKLMNLTVRGASQEELGGLAGLPARQEGEPDAEREPDRNTRPEVLTETGHKISQSRHDEPEHGDGDGREQGLVRAGHRASAVSDLRMPGCGLPVDSPQGRQDWLRKAASPKWRICRAVLGRPHLQQSYGADDDERSTQHQS